MAYNLLGQQGPKGSRNPDPNLSDAEATYLYDNPPGQGDNKGLDARGNPVDAKDVQEKLDENEPIRFTDGPDEDTTTTTTTATKSKKDEIKDMQKLLKDAGFNPGPIDGIIGPQTRAAAQAYINNARGQSDLNKRRREVGEILGITVTPGTTTTTDNAASSTQDSFSFIDALKEAEAEGAFDPSKVTRADVSDDVLEQLSRGKNYSKALRGGLSEEEYKKYRLDLLNEYKDEIENNPTFAGKIGTWLNYAGRSLGEDVRNVGNLVKEIAFNVGEDFLEFLLPNEGGVTDAFFAGILGQESGSTPITDFTDKFKLTWDNENKYFKNADGQVLSFGELTKEEVEEGVTLADKEEEVKNINENNNNNQTSPPQGSGPQGGGGSAAPPPAPDFAYNAIGQYGPKGQSNEGYEYKFNDAPGRGNNPGVTKIGDPDPDFKTQTIGEPFKEIFITIYKDGAEKQILESDFALFQSQGWSRIPPDLEAQRGTTDITQPTEETTTGPGQVVSDQLNTFNNIPQNSVLIEAAGQLYLGYEVPGAYGQLYNGSPIFMLYEVLGNDVYEAGILTQGATPNINVKLGSVADLNQYGIVVGGTDELTDTVEHPFIRFVENFEAGKRVNPWLNDTEINPLTGITYQQEAIEFLAEQALEQWTPEETQVKYEASDWYRKSTTAQKTWLTTLLTQPVQAEQDIQDKRIEVKIAMEANGIASPPDALINWVADKAVSGQWTQVYTDQQVALLADPYKPGTRDSGMVNFIEGVGVGTLDRLTVGEKTVKDLYRRYLGPSLGNASDDEIAEKAGLLRSDPDAEEQLKAYLEQQRLAMFGNYTNPTLTYNDIVQPYKNLVNQVWGQQVDETQDWFIKMVQDNDIEKAYTTLREKGIEQGIERVQDQALNDLQRSIGQGQIAPQLGANN